VDDLNHERQAEVYDTDVLVIGYGAAGANAALSAHDAGAEVMIMEKLGYPGGNSGVCAGAMVLPVSIEEAVQYYRSLSFGTVNEEMIHAFAEAMVNIPRLLIRLGIEFKINLMEPSYFPNLFQGKLKRIQISPTGQKGFLLLENLIKNTKIKVLMNTRAVELIQDANTREILGVKAYSDGEKITVMARKGVILACGGYEYNKTMLANFNFPGATDYIFPWGTPGNTGDGIKLASEAGGALWHMSPVEWYAFCAKKPSEQFGTAVGVGLGKKNPDSSFLIVNRHGKRFMAETTTLLHRKAPLEILTFDHDDGEYKNLPAFMIFDEAYRRKGSIANTPEEFFNRWGGPVGYNMVHNIYEWSYDNRSEIEKKWILQADTIGDLASKIEVDTGVFQETIHKFNYYCNERQDSEFGRTGATLAPLKTPPYYAIEIALTLINTQGGPKHNINCQVVDFNDRPIPRLYAAGELGSFFGFLYQGGNNYPEAWAFGQIAGKRAATDYFSPNL